MNVDCLFFGKSDLSNAFRIIPGKVDQQKFLTMKMRHPVSKELMYFIDLCMPFGASISCAIFQAFSDALKHITQVLLNIDYITNYLDDFLFLSYWREICQQMLKGFLAIGRRIGCPVSLDKTEGPSEYLIFLGILLNGRKMVLSIPLEKCYKALNLLTFAVNKRKVMIKFMQSLTGTLNFLQKAIVPDRAFTHRMYAKVKLTNKEGLPLKAHHHVWLDREFVRDCYIWIWFLQNQSCQALCHPFADFDPYQSRTTLNFYSDASLNPELGMGMVFDNEWSYGQWDSEFIINEKA